MVNGEVCEACFENKYNRSYFFYEVRKCSRFVHHVHHVHQFRYKFVFFNYGILTHLTFLLFSHPSNQKDRHLS